MIRLEMRGTGRGGATERTSPETSKESHLHFPVAGSKFDSSPGHEGRVLFETRSYIGSTLHGTWGIRGEVRSGVLFNCMGLQKVFII